jgi:hypothetical protein
MELLEGVAAWPLSAPSRPFPGWPTLPPSGDDARFTRDALELRWDCPEWIGPGGHQRIIGNFQSGWSRG